MPVTIVSDPDWLLACWANTCRNYLCKELLVGWVGEKLVEVTVRVEISVLRLALIRNAGRARVLTGDHTVAGSHRLLLVMRVASIGAGLAGFRSQGAAFLLNFLLKCHGLRAAVERYRLDRLTFLCRGNLGSAMILSDGRLSFGKLHYCLELLWIFQIKGVLRLAKRVWNHLGRLFEVAAHGRV